MKPKYEEKIEIIPNINGKLFCVLSWKEHTFQEELPSGIDRWPEVEFKSHLKSFVIPRLRIELLKVQRAALEAGQVPPEDCVPVSNYTPGDLIQLNKAAAKRAMRAAKNAATLEVIKSKLN